MNLNSLNHTVYIIKILILYYIKDIRFLNDCLYSTDICSLVADNYSIQLHFSSKQKTINITASNFVVKCLIYKEFINEFVFIALNVDKIKTNCNSCTLMHLF